MKKILWLRYWSGLWTFEACLSHCLIISILGCVFFTLYFVHLQPKQGIPLKIGRLHNFHCFKMAENVLRKLMTLLFWGSALDQDLLLPPSPPIFVVLESSELLKRFLRASISICAVLWLAFPPFLCVNFFLSTVSLALNF
jgi:hypothetical protein